MSLYPHLSQPEHRGCGINFEVVCPTFPCVHVPCHDPDWLDDCEEALANEQLNRMVWNLYRSIYEKKIPTSTIKDQLSEEEWAIFEPKVERCHRIKSKWDQIIQDNKPHRLRDRIQYMVEEEQLLNDEAWKDDPGVIRRKEERRKAMLLQTKL